jgi:hypothetical protein
MSEQASAFETPERASLAHAIAAYAKAQADAENGLRRVRTALVAVAMAEGGEDADPALWGALLTA